MDLAKDIEERKKLRELIGTLLESSFYLEMDVRERLAMVKVMASTLL